MRQDLRLPIMIFLLSGTLFLTGAWFGKSVDQTVRDMPEVRQAMDQYRDRHATCEWCHQQRPIEVHHEVPLWLDDSPANADDTAESEALT